MTPALYERLRQIYTAFNGRDIDTVLTMLHPQVQWQNAMEGGCVHGHQALREYWTRQWTQLDPHIEPIDFVTDTEGRILVDGHQTLHNMQGVLVLDLMLRHIFTIQDNLIIKMEFHPV